MLNHIYAKKGIPYRFILGQKDSSDTRRATGPDFSPLGKLIAFAADRGRRLVGQLRQSVFGGLGGDDDANDADRLGLDAAPGSDR